MRFIHTSDWHLGRLFFGETLTEEQAALLAEFFVVAKDLKPDAILIAGDVYDRSVPPAEAVELLDETLSKLVLECEIPVLMIAGNHDSGQRLGFGRRFFGWLRFFWPRSGGKRLPPCGWFRSGPPRRKPGPAYRKKCNQTGALRLQGKGRAL